MSVATRVRTPATLSARGLTVRLPRGGDRPHAIRDVSFAVALGEVLAVVGRSGSGKSMLAAALLDLLPPGARLESGSVVATGRIGAVFQDPAAALNPVLTIARQVGEALERTMPAAVVRARTEALLAEVGLGARIALATPEKLSGGERQRAVIAAALATDPAVLIADEPTAMLDAATEAGVLRLMRELAQRRGMALILISHDLALVRGLADRILVLDGGEVVEGGCAATILCAPRAQATRRLVSAIPSGVAPTRPAPEAACLAVGGLTKRYGDRLVLANVALAIGRGEVLGLVGASGSGKSTLARAVTRLVEPDAGQVVLDGTDLVPLSSAALRKARRRIQMVFQDPGTSLDPRATALAAIARAARAAGDPDPRATARRLIAAVGLHAGAAGRVPAALSGGERQRVAIARALATDPDVLIADEAVSALDTATKAEIVALLAQLRDARGLAILFITHDLSIAAALCDRIAVMDAGRIVEVGTAATLLEAPTHPATRRLVAARPNSLRPGGPV